ncbi:MAG: hypothetical protein A3E26_02495 [Chlamydiae bacterium RIFCSPHIGHO2_12_FULL_49_32]|nr:MAG: hypothetical protein A3D18_05125 [Chlamydiae bacterium RIFCSPHIGHO2_02_FULL_49_29]OGN63706.1 MAG: hypothetical protein A3E26_02495 [Chlamydiae bacterium RIFCSPHIGHO2_12_FULL_49_32]
MLFSLLTQSLFSDAPLSHILPQETPIVNYIKPLDLREFESGLDDIDCIYVINLDQRPDKWARVKRAFDEKKLKVNRISAVNGWQLSEEMLKEMCGPYPIRCQAGHFGCLLSHLSILKDACQRGFKTIWICEDDIDFLSDIHQIPELLRELSDNDPEWDILFTDVLPRIYRNGKMIHYVHHQVCDPRPDVQQIKPREYYLQKSDLTDNLLRIHKRSGTTSMILSRSGIQKMLYYFTHVYFWSPIDQDMHSIPNLHEYVPSKDIVSNWIEADSDTVRSIDKSKENTATPAPESVSLKRGLSYQESGNLTHALEEFHRYSVSGTSEAEVFWALYQLAKTQQDLGDPATLFLKAYIKALYYLPTRAEPFYSLSRYFRLEREFSKAYQFCKIGVKLTPPHDTQYCEPWIYDYGILLELALCAYHLGKYEEFKEVSHQLLHKSTLPREFRAQLIALLTNEA